MHKKFLLLIICLIFILHFLGCFDNSKPTAPVLDITPNQPTKDDNLRARIINKSIDEDGDSITYTYEWYKNVCKTCDKLGPTGCLDKVTEKFPGKCDPILHYEREKQQKS